MACSKCGSKTHVASNSNFHRQSKKGAKRKSAKNMKKVLAIKVGTTNTPSGNPRRGWLIHERDGKRLGFVDEGFEGSAAVRQLFPNAQFTFAMQIQITPKQYNEFNRAALN